jgi:hypothetical protein
MKWKDLQKKLPAIFFLLFSIYICKESLRLGLGTWHKPGAGFVPFWSGVPIGILALLMLIQSIWLNKASVWEKAKEKINWRAIGLTLVYFLGYVALLEYLGFITDTMLFVGVVLKSVEKKGWFVTIFVSLGMAFASYYVFKVLLQSELPKGFFGF